MFNKIDIYKKNWLLVLAGISLCLAILNLFVLGEDYQYTGSRNASDSSLSVLLISALVFGPLLEELSYRGMFVNNKKIKITSLILLTIFILFVQKLFLIPLLIIFFCLFLLTKKENPILFDLAILCNIALFALTHYEIAEFLDFETLFFSLFQVAVGSICIWITLNFNLTKSIIFHFAWNLVVMSMLFYSLQFPDQSPEVIKSENLTIKWERVPRFSNPGWIVHISGDSLTAENVEAKTLYNFLETEESSAILPNEPYVKYNISIKTNGPTTNEEIKVLTNKFLKKELVYENPKS